MALQGARERQDGEYRNHVLTAWLTGLLSGMADPKTYPKLEDLFGDEKPEEPEPDQARQNARMWGIWLQVENKRAND